MSNFYSKVNLVTGSQRNKNKFDLSSNHITTQDFYKMKPVYINELMPGGKYNISLSCLCRLQNLRQPFYGSAQIITRAFFVPFRVLLEGWTNYLTDTPYTYSDGVSKIPTIPTVNNLSLVNLFLANSMFGEWDEELDDAQRYDKYCIAYPGTLVPQGFRPDFHVDSSIAPVNGSTVCNNIVLTAKGRIVYDILVNLGYKIDWGTESVSGVSFSALPLLAFVKIYNDWYLNRAYADPSNLDQYFRGRKSSLTPSDLFGIFENVYKVCLKSDYFTSAFDKPTGPNDLSSGFSIPDNTVSKAEGTRKNVITSTGTTDSGTTSSTPVIANSSGTQDGALTAPASLSQYAIDLLHVATDYVTRHRLAGTLPIDRYLADYGFELSSEKLNRCDYIGMSNVPINISDVTQTSPDVLNGNSVESGVGSYTGKGIGFDNQGHFTFEADEFGYLIITSYVDTKTSYVDGRPRFIFHGLTRNQDFFHGDFDGLGYQAIRKDELIGNCFDDRYRISGFSPDAAFGFINTYAEYKTAQDNLSGNFLLRSKNTDLEGWYMARRFDMASARGKGDVHSLAFTQAQPKEYMNIFFDMNDVFDHFYTIFRFNVEAYLPAKPLYDMYDFDDDGRSLTMQVNGRNVVD